MSETQTEGTGTLADVMPRPAGATPVKTPEAQPEQKRQRVVDAERAHPQAKVVLDRQQVDHDREAAFDVAGLGPVLPVEAPGARTLDAAGKALRRDVGGGGRDLLRNGRELIASNGCRAALHRTGDTEAGTLSCA